MFDFIRTHSRLTLGLLLLLVIPSFIFFGVQGYARFTDGSAASVASVDGRSISRAEWENAHQRNVDRVRRERPELDARLLDTPELRRQTLDALLRERLLLTAASQMHLAPSDARLQRLFQTDPQFAQWRNADGSVNRDMLAIQGMTSEIFAQRLRQEFATQQVLAGVARSTVVTPAETAAALDPLLQRREIQFQRFEPAAYRASLNPSDAEIERFYKEQEASFRAPESAQIEYLVLDLDALARDAQPTEDELRKFYADNAGRYTVPEERRASHILIAAAKDAPSAERDKARARATELLVEARKNPAGFAELARKNSQDPGSAAKGGDLDFFGRGAMVKPFEDAAFKLKSGEISDVIETDFGYHVLMVTDARGGEKKPFEAVKGEIAAEVRHAIAQRRWPELAEQFTNLVYEQSDSLKPAADKLKLEIRTATVPHAVTPGTKGPLGSAKFIEALFAADAVVQKRNTDAVEFGTNQLVSGRVVQHTPSRVPPLAEVKDQVRQRLIARLASQQAAKDGQAKLAALKQSPAETLANSATVSRLQPAGLPRPVLDAVLRADAAKLPAAIGVDLGEQGYAVVKLVRVLPRDKAGAGEASLQEQFTQALAAAESEAYLQALKTRFKAEIKPGAALAPAQAASGAGG